MSGEEDRAGLLVRGLTPSHAAVVATWRYDGPWAVYNGGDCALLTAGNGYHALIGAASGTLLGYVCVGAEARVAGLDEQPGVVDVGIGLDPDIVGRGRGASIAVRALDWVESHYESTEVRAVVQAWNKRSLRLCTRLGFRVVGHHEVLQGATIVVYVVLRRLRPTEAPR